MTEVLKHECGIVLLRLLKPLSYYKEKYGSEKYGLQKLYLLMEKQHNRGQDGAGAVALKLNVKPGHKYISRERSNQEQPIKKVFSQIQKRINQAESKAEYHTEYKPFTAELYLGHLRYGTFGKNSIDNVHPVMRQNNWRSRNLVLAGNFNLTNVDELIANLIDVGQHPKDHSDTVTILENVGHFLDEENQGLFDLYKKRGYSHTDISPRIEEKIDIGSILRESSKRWDGGYAIAGVLGHGDAFVLRDPAGIRPAFYYHDDEIAVVTSERPVIQTIFNVKAEKIKQVSPGHAIIIRRNGRIYEELINQPVEKKSCSFERIYFSRGSDKDIYKERKKLGELTLPQILKKIDNDVLNSVFSFIPNTAETSFLGLVHAVDKHLNEYKKKQILSFGGNISEKKLTEILNLNTRVEKIAVKDAKLRTFITQGEARNDLVGHVYDITYGTVNENIDNLVVIDDSIVRGTTLRQSVLRILDRLSPKHIVIVSSSPQIRYPDCYGIDMANLGEFIAFQAVIALLEETGQQNIYIEVYQKSKLQQNLPKEDIVNYVKEIYAPFSDEQISDKIAQLITTDDINSKVSVVYQTIKNLHTACPNDLGDWYFTGNYPTPGGNKVVNKAFINYYEGKKGRAY